MASGFLPTPGKVVDGEPIGPCVEPCEHTDCAQTLKMAATECFFCSQPIGFETAFVDFDVTGKGVYCLCHTACVHKTMNTRNE